MNPENHGDPSHQIPSHVAHPDGDVDHNQLSAFLSLVHNDHHPHVHDHDVMHHDGMKSAEKSNLFEGLCFTWSGKFSYPREEIRKKIEDNGGTCVENVSKKVNESNCKLIIIVG